VANIYKYYVAYRLAAAHQAQAAKVGSGIAPSP
jgi:hypothetical protein